MQRMEQLQRSKSKDENYHGAIYRLERRQNSLHEVRANSAMQNLHGRENNNTEKDG